ncbi:MAG TPA: universal stress protein [Methylomirabilota bacterium]|jgi:nucleotide-binding universal stress UspA family protein|nr:universal stress protein [Methylomirabilota bacterium]
MTAISPEVRESSRAVARILLAVHGGEPNGWGPAARRLIAMWARASVRVLAIVAVPSPPFTSLIPTAAGLYRAAREAWEDGERKRVQRAIDDLAPALPGEVEIVWERVSYGDPGRAIAEHARVWSADVVLIAASPASGPWLGAVHDHVLRRARCAVLVTPPAEG